jgi:hypothetical protein
MALSKKGQQIKDAVEGDGKGVEALCGRADTGGSRVPQRLPTQSDRGEYNNADLDRLYTNIEKGWEGTAADETPGSPYGNVLGRVKITRVVKSNNDNTNQETPNT